MLKMTIFLCLSLVVSAFEFPNQDLSPSILEFSKLGDLSDGNLSVVLTIINELIKDTNQSEEALRTNVAAAYEEKEVTEKNYERAKTTRRSACETLNTSDVLRKFHDAKEAEDNAKVTLAEKNQSYQDSLQAHKEQNVEFEIDSLHWINNLAHRLLTGSHMPTTSPTTFPTLSPTKVPTLSPTLVPTTAPTQPPPPALSNMFIRKHRRIYLHSVSGNRWQRAIWIDSENNIICLGICGLDDSGARQWAMKSGSGNYRGNPETLASDDPLAFSWVRNESFKMKPSYTLEYGAAERRKNFGWSNINNDVVSMWGKVDVSVPAVMQTKKPVSVTYGDPNLGLYVLFEDGSIWWKPSQKTVNELLSITQQWDQPRRLWNEARNAVDRMSAGTFPFESVKSWFQVSGEMKFSRISSGPGADTFVSPFAWDENQEFYQYLGRDIHPQVRILFQTCDEMGYNFENLDTTYPWPPPPHHHVNHLHLYYFVKFPRECYVGEGNIVDVQYQADKIWMHFDGNGGTGNLWLYGACPAFHEYFMDPSDPRRMDGSYLDSKRHPKIKKKNFRWCQIGQNRRVTTFAVAYKTVFIATPDGVFCIGDNYGQLCNHTHPSGSYVNWTKVNTSAFDGVRVAQMIAFRTNIWFLLTDGRIFHLERLPWGGPWAMQEKFKEITSTNEIVDWAMNGGGFMLDIVLVNRTGSHYHRGTAPTNCITSRDEHLAFNGSSNRWPPEKFVLCDDVANDLGYISDANLWL